MLSFARKTVLIAGLIVAAGFIASPAFAGKRGNCITIEQTGDNKIGLTNGMAEWRAKRNLRIMARKDVVKQAGGEMRLVETLFERCDAVNVSSLNISCRGKYRFCK